MERAEQVVLPHVVGNHGLRRMIVIPASSLALRRINGPEHARGFVTQAYKAPALAAWQRAPQLWLQSLPGHGAGGKGPASAAGVSPAGAGGAAGSDSKLRAEVEVLKKDLVEERKKQKKGGKADGGKGRPPD